MWGKRFILIFHLLKKMSFFCFFLSVVNNHLIFFSPHPSVLFFVCFFLFLFKAAFRTLTLLVFPPYFLFVSSHLTSFILYLPSFVHCLIPPSPRPVRCVDRCVFFCFTTTASFRRKTVTQIAFCHVEAARTHHKDKHLAAF